MSFDTRGYEFEINALQVDVKELQEKLLEVERENKKYREEMAKINRGIPSEWAYAQLEKELVATKAKLNLAIKTLEKIACYQDYTLKDMRKLADETLEEVKE